MINRRALLSGLAALGGVALWPWRELAARAWLAGLPQDCAPALAAAIDRVLPGAVEAGAMAYVEHWMRRQPFKTLRRRFVLAGLEMNRLARSQHGKPFAACGPAEQDAILAVFRAGEIGGQRLNSRQVLEHLVTLAVESFYGDPKYGGNRDRIGWKTAGVKHCWYAPKRVRRSGNLPY